MATSLALPLASVANPTRRLLNTPIELVKVRQQLLVTPAPAHLVAWRILRDDRFGLWRGLVPTCLRDSGYGTYFLAVCVCLGRLLLRYLLTTISMKLSVAFLDLLLVNHLVYQFFCWPELQQALVCDPCSSNGLGRPEDSL
jgi:hypothetical protein